MPLHRTIGISLAFLMASAGAIAKVPETRGSHNIGQLQTPEPGKAETRNGIRGALCRAAGHRRGRAHHQNIASYSSRDAAGAPDAYIGPVHPIGRSEIGTAAWYNRVGAQTSSGEILDTVTATAAHRSLPLASYAKVTNLDTGGSLIVKINDRGPWTRRFIIDLSPRAADELEVRRAGVAAVMVEPVAAGAASEEVTPTVATFQTTGTGTAAAH